MTIDERTEWLESDGQGGFASGTASGIRTRRYHALLLPATTPPTGRVVLVNGVDASLETSAGVFALSTQRYAPDVLHPDGASRITSFTADPWPTWQFGLPDGTRVCQEIFVERATGATWMAWTLLDHADVATLRVRPFLSGRDYHSLHRENGAFRFGAQACGASVTFYPYDGVPALALATDGEYHADPQWYRNFLYTAERERGLDDTEDLASPGTLAWSLTAGRQRAILMLRARSGRAFASATEVVAAYETARSTERRRRASFPTALDRAADAYLVQRGSGLTVVAGYPWFTDWGRDTFIALRGLCLATGRLAEARDILLEWAGAVSEGMLPNRFPDRGEAPEFNSVDASLWYVVTVGEFLQLERDAGVCSDRQRAALTAAVAAIVSGYAAGTRFGIRMDDDGLLAAGERGQQLTWMDARVGDREITPRIGKPVEVQALWFNALAVAGSQDARWLAVMPSVRGAFLARFWNSASGTLADVVDVDHVRGTRDDTLRPNQIFAVGGLPLALASGRQARRIIAAVETDLLTPAGLRSLTPQHPSYARRYAGAPEVRDGAYHQGTVWPWLLGPFVEAWVRAHGDCADTRTRARKRFLGPFTTRHFSAGQSHIAEIADGEAPFTPRGCPFQAWSLGEYLRLERKVLTVATPSDVIASALEDAAQR
jgi:predicted glycogen debranching enzyme